MPDRVAMMGNDTKLENESFLTGLSGTEKQILQKLLDNTGVSAADLFRADSSELKNVAGGSQTWENIKMGLDAQITTGKIVSINDEGNVEMK